MKTCFLYIIGMFIFTTQLWADINVIQPDLGFVIKKIEQRQNQSGGVSESPVNIIYKNNQIIFSQTNKQSATITFNDTSTTIEKHFQLKASNDSYAFVVLLNNKGSDFQHFVQKVNGADALFFINDNEIFIYTQQQGEKGSIELKEWIYAIKPNSPTGSQWTWTFKSEPWQWPLTLEMQTDGKCTVNRHVPISGFPIDTKARSQYMLDMMVKFKRDEPIKKYFPFPEPIVTMPSMHLITKEGVTRIVDSIVENSSIDNPDTPRPKVGLNFNRWDDHWHSTYTTTLSANPNEYPILIE